MSIDPYAPCPCGSGKKLKFCCADLAVDIEKVQRMIAGDQPHAALKHLQQLLEKEPDRASLLDLRAMLELSLHEWDAARATIDAYLAAHPTNVSAHAQAALLVSATESGRQAVSHLQEALEQVGDEMPLRVLEAIGAVGHALLLEGDLVAGRGHLLLYAGIAPEGDNLALELLLRMNLQAGLPLLVRDYLVLAECPPEAPWKTEFDETMRLSTRGQWRRAESRLAKLREEVGPVPAVVYNLALVRGWLGDTLRFVADLREYAALDVPLQNAVEAEALAQLVDPDLEDPELDTVRLTYSITDIEALAERLVADKRVEDYPMDPAAMGEDEQTRPRSTHILLDRPSPATGVDIQRDEVPSVLAFLSLYGKRTDREAQLAVTTDRDASFDRVQALLGEVTGDTMGDLEEEEVMAQKSLSDESLSWRWRLPDDTPPEVRRRLLAEQRREAILERWTTAPRGALDGKSPREAVGDPALRIALMASALIIEQAAVDPNELSLFAELRRQLELPQPERCDPTAVDLEHLPLVRVAHMDLPKIQDKPLARLMDRSVLMGANLATLLLARELVGRSEVADDVDLSRAFRQLIRLELDLSRAYDWIAKARQWAQSKNQSEAEWAIQELELSIERGDARNLQRVLNEIRDRYVEEPGVAEATYQILYQAGLVAPRSEVGELPSQGPALAAAAQPTSVGLNPSGAAASPSTASGEKPVIWTPS